MRYVCFAAVLVLAPCRFWATEGPVAIDQEKAIAGGVTPEDSPGFPVTISRPGSYKLMSNLTTPDANTTTILITADSVTLDLNGFSIIGPLFCTAPEATCLSGGSGYGIDGRGAQSAGPRGVRVMNGSVRGFGQIGVAVTGSGNSVERVHAYGNVGGGIAVAGSVLKSQATQNGAFGILATAVRDCESAGNVGDGILLDGNGGVASGNVSSGNGGAGIVASFGTAAGNTAFANAGFGISASCPSAIVGNTIVTAAGGSGIETRGSGCVLANNAARP